MIIAMLTLVIASLILLFMVTQIIIPYMRGTVFFPLFSKETVLQKELEEVRQESVEVDMEKEIKVIKEKVNKKREEVTGVKKKRKRD